MTAIADRADELLDLAGAALTSGRIDLVRDADVHDLFRLAIEVLAPAISDRDAEIANLKRELATARGQLAVHQGIATGLERVRMGRVQ